ncbi:MAG: hypothetical protein ACJAT6_001421, partial [Akkermansiaceae bacterium]
SIWGVETLGRTVMDEDYSIPASIFVSKDS